MILRQMCVSGDLTPVPLLMSRATSNKYCASMCKESNGGKKNRVKKRSKQ